MILQKQIRLGSSLLLLSLLLAGCALPKAEILPRESLPTPPTTVSSKPSQAPKASEARSPREAEASEDFLLSEARRKNLPFRLENEAGEKRYLVAYVDEQTALMRLQADELGRQTAALVRYDLEDGSEIELFRNSLKEMPAELRVLASSSSHVLVNSNNDTMESEYRVVSVDGRKAPFLLPFETEGLMRAEFAGDVLHALDFKNSLVIWTVGSADYERIENVQSLRGNGEIAAYSVEEEERSALVFYLSDGHHFILQDDRQAISKELVVTDDAFFLLSLGLEGETGYQLERLTYDETAMQVSPSGVILAQGIPAGYGLQATRKGFLFSLHQAHPHTLFVYQAGDFFRIPLSNGQEAMSSYAQLPILGKDGSLLVQEGKNASWGALVWDEAELSLIEYGP